MSAPLLRARPAPPLTLTVHHTPHGLLTVVSTAAGALAAAPQHALTAAAAAQCDKGFYVTHAPCPLRVSIRLASKHLTVLTDVSGRSGGPLDAMRARCRCHNSAPRCRCDPDVCIHAVTGASKCVYIN